jgi:[ribosomal protein S18]-alanine N-acetyltransferase
MLHETPVHIRWMIRRDMVEVLEIEKACFEFPWSEEDYLRCLQQRNCIGMVAEHNEKVVGVIIYELQKTRLVVLNLAVHPDYRHQDIGTQMVKKLTSKLSPQRRNHIILEVRESNLYAQLFFRDMGFRAVSIIRDYYHDESGCDESAYTFRYDYSPVVRPSRVRPELGPLV